MYKKILVPVEPNHGEKHEAALKMARQLGEPDAEITVLSVIEPVPGYFALAESLPELTMQAADQVQAEMQAFVGEGSDVKVKVLHGHAATEIIAHAEKEGDDCIVIASHKPGLADYFLGSTSGRVVQHAPCAVHVIR